MGKLKIILSCFGGPVEPATLVFDTIRVGFPNADIDCHWTGNREDVELVVKKRCKDVGAKFIKESPLTTNDVIGNKAIKEESGKIVFLDADVVFWDKVEGYQLNTTIAGRFIPKHFCPAVKLVTQNRLHPSLLFIRSMEEVRRYLYKSNNRFVPVNYCSPFVVCRAGQRMFYDSFTNLFHCLGGQTFDEEMLNKYDHLFASSFVDELPAELSHLKDLHKYYYKHPEQLKGVWKQQNDYFNSRLA